MRSGCGITDDLLDAVGSAESAGKKTGKDAAQGKATILSILGVEGARAQARKLADSAASVISVYGDKSNNLRRLADYLVTRQS
jgi:farnesyl diphosphate synthase